MIMRGQDWPTRRREGYFNHPSYDYSCTSDKIDRERERES